MCIEFVGGVVSQEVSMAVMVGIPWLIGMFQIGFMIGRWVRG